MQSTLELNTCTPAATRYAGSAAHRIRASRVLPRGVSSSPRATQRPVPLVMVHAEGAHVTDIDGNTYVDYAMGYGPLILGHSPKVVIDAVQREMALGLRVGSVNRAELELAERIALVVPSAQVSAFLSSGTEACQIALRIARAATGRMQVVKFRCHYHGWADGIHLATQPGRDGSTTIGQDPDALHHVSVLDWGDVDGLVELLRGDIAAVIMEPAAINAGCFEPPVGFLQRVRDLTAASGTMLIFDEVITGFRLSLGGAQERYGVTPDLSVLGKALGAGLPIGAVTGSDAAMEPVIDGTMMLRGTFNGNPLSTAAGVACLDYLAANASEVYPRMDRYAHDIAAHVRNTATQMGIAIAANCVGPCVQLFAGADAVPTLHDMSRVDKDATLVLTELIVEQGVATLPRGLMYLSTAHVDADITFTLGALTKAIEAFARLPLG
ncbi:MAG: aminotransferase class III-fold pyridoxal phosphate-dependent enzyme [Betaproteobacteria bacterium]